MKGGKVFVRICLTSISGFTLSPSLASAAASAPQVALLCQQLLMYEAAVASGHRGSGTCTQGEGLVSVTMPADTLLLKPSSTGQTDSWCLFQVDSRDIAWNSLLAHYRS